MQKFINLAAAILLSVPVRAATLVPDFTGTSASFAGFDTTGNIFLGGNTALRGIADVTVALVPGQILFREVVANLDSATWSGSGNFVNPSTFQNVGVSLSIVTDPTSFTITSTQMIPLTSTSAGALQWASSFSGVAAQVSTLRFSGTYTLTGPTQTVTGSFSHLLQGTTFVSDGLLYTGLYPEEIGLKGGGYSRYLNQDFVLVNNTVDGIPIRIDTFGIRNGMGIAFEPRSGDATTNLTAVPEPSALLLLMVAPLCALRVRRRVTVARLPRHHSCASEPR